MIVAEFASFGAEAQVGNRGDLDALDFKAESPFVQGFVLKFEFESFVLNVG